MLAPKRSSPQKVITLTLVFLAALGTMGWLVYTNFVKVSTEPSAEWQAEISRTARQQYPPVPPVNPAHPIFSSPQFFRLKSFVTLPVLAGATGRQNPFEVISYYVGTTTPAAGP